MASERDRGAPADPLAVSSSSIRTPSHTGVSQVSGVGSSLRSQTLQLAPVEVEGFDEYVLVGKLGHGGMAEVFLALSSGPSGFRKLLVIKRLHVHLEDEPSMVEMFLDEARLAARLNHPHVVQTNKVGEHRGHHFLAMELLEGQALNRVLKRARERDRPLGHALAARVVCDALDGLHYAHEARDFDGAPLSIVHRDVSPHNIFVTYEGQVKLLDFGIAKATTQQSQTRTGLIKGKFAYIAPEQARGESVDRRADVWSMGVTLWEALTGQRLFKGVSEVAILQSTLQDEIPAPSRVDPAVPAELSRICERALQREVEARYPTAAAFREELEEWLASQTKGASRSALSQYMRDVFADTIEEQRRLVHDCVERVQRADPTGSVPGASLSSSGVLRAPRELGELRARGEAVTRLDRRGGATSSSSMTALAPAPVWPKVAAVVLVAVVGAALALWLGASRAAEDTRVVAIDDPVAVARPTPEAPPAVVAARAQPAEELPVAAEPVAPVAPMPPAAEPVRRAARRPSTAEAPRPQPEPEVLAPRAPAEAPGRLQLDTTPYSVVSLGAQRLGITPIDVELPAGSHTLTLRNPEQGIETTYRVTVRAGESTSRRVAIE